MADISKPNEPTTNVESPVGDQPPTQKDDGELQSGLGTTVKGPGTPATKDKTEEERKESRERVRTIFIVLTFIGMCIAIGISCFSYLSSKRSADAAEKSAAAAQRNAGIAKATFEIVQRASVNLGLPDGKIGEFLPGARPSASSIVLYFRNYGTITAYNTIVEFWPMTIFFDKAEPKIHIPAPEETGTFGPSMPLGFPFPVSQTYTGSSFDDVESGKVILQIVGRIRYADTHKMYCESFLVTYARNPVSKFMIFSGGDLTKDFNFCVKRDFSLHWETPRTIPPTNVPYREQEDKK